uniref:Histone H1-beta, late embryonic-like n=1 Tax=Ciona intestinalis TaxID=7719 RepID=F6T9K3_CIOIN|nr:histone H1-beta, late embryonic-like [Ciona intestinalis]XP_026696021.1 histone H1-beta, late embryonic-like [Ciona intestinalis]|eukprot:XP_002119566.1 histone H1-beta, late embryonic-like [Ciona intestinalis]
MSSMNTDEVENEELSTNDESEEELESEMTQSPSQEPLKTAIPKKVSGARKKPYLEMVVDTIEEIGEKQGSSFMAISKGIVEKYSLNPEKVKSYIKHAVVKGIKDEVLIRPKRKTGNAELKGLSGRFKVNPEHKKKQKALIKKNKSAKTKKTSIKKPAGLPPAESLKEKSYSVQLAKDKLKKARLSLNIAASPVVAKKRKKMMKEKLSAVKFQSTEDASENETAAKKAVKTKGSKEDKKPPNKKTPVSKKSKTDKAKSKKGDSTESKAPAKKDSKSKKVSSNDKPASAEPTKKPRSKKK